MAIVFKHGAHRLTQLVIIIDLKPTDASGLSVLKVFVQCTSPAD
jgi:hypothetical protein